MKQVAPRSGILPEPLTPTAGDATARPRQRRSRQKDQPVISPKVFLSIFIAMILGVYTNLPINIGVQIAGGFALVPGLAFLFLLREKVKAIGLYIILCLVCAALPTIFGLIRHVPIADALQSYGGFALSLLAAVGLYLAVQDQDRNFLCRILVIMASVVSICIVLEVFTPFNEVSNQVRKILYNGRFIYDADMRDMSLYGHIRPKVFAQEPSMPARFMAYILSCVLALATDNISRVIAGACFLLAMVLISSPSIYAAFILLAMLFVVLRLTRARFDLPALNAIVFAGAIAVMLAVANFQGLVGLLGHQRAEATRSGKDLSAAMRMLIPPAIFYASLDRYGVLGAGLGSKQQLQEIAGPVFNEYPGSENMKDLDGNWDWTNAFVDLFIELGPIFALIFLLLLTRVFPTPFPGATIIAFEAVFLLDTGLPGPKNWAYFGLVASCLSIAIRDHSASLTRSRRRTLRRAKEIEPAGGISSTSGHTGA